MTTAKAQTPKAPGRFYLPDPPKGHPDEMTSYKHVSKNGNAHYLSLHLGEPETTLVTADRYIVARPTQSMAGSYYPDLLVAFDVDPDLYEDSNGYIIEEQGKPPDFVLEVASRSTGRIDVGVKREAYESLGIREYWRFDETGDHHGARLAGDRLEGGRYVPIEVAEVADGVLQGYSAALKLNLRWEQGRLVLHDPKTGRRLPTFEDERVGRMQERAAREQAEAAREAAETAREQAEAARAQERAAREQAEARVRELEAESRRLRGS